MKIQSDSVINGYHSTFNIDEVISDKEKDELNKKLSKILITKEKNQNKEKRKIKLKKIVKINK